MIKTITFTLMHFCIAFAVSFALTGNAMVSSTIAFIEPLCNSFGYYFHEIFWDWFRSQ